VKHIQPKDGQFDWPAARETNLPGKPTRIHVISYVSSEKLAQKKKLSRKVPMILLFFFAVLASLREAKKMFVSGLIAKRPCPGQVFLLDQEI